MPLSCCAVRAAAVQAEDQRIGQARRNIAGLGLSLLGGRRVADARVRLGQRLVQLGRLRFELQRRWRFSIASV